MPIPFAVRPPRARNILLALLGLGLAAGGYAGSLNKYERPGSGFTPLPQPKYLPQMIAPAQQPPQMQQAPAPSLEMRLKDLNSPLYEKPKALIRDASQEQREQWLELYRQRVTEALEANDMSRVQYYNNLIRFTRQEIEAHAQ